MTLSEFEQLRRDLRETGISLWIEADEAGADRLVAWPSHKLTPNQIATLKANKPDILRWHRQRMVDLLPDATTCDQWRQRYCNQHRTEANQ